MLTRIKNYIDPDGLAILIRRAGGSARTESDNGSVVVLSRQSLQWIGRLCRKHQWITPAGKRIDR